MKKVNVVGATAMLALGLGATGTASAAIVPTTVTAVGPYGNSLSVINDGVFPPDYTSYNDSRSVYYGERSFTGGNATTFAFSFGGLYSINQVLGAVDFNDDYIFTFFNGATSVGSYMHAAGSGPVNYGLQNFTASITPIAATSAVLSTANGDLLYGVGEVEFNGTAVTAAVPEPVSWVMMIFGFGMIGAGLRFRQRRTVLRYI